MVLGRARHVLRRAFPSAVACLLYPLYSLYCATIRFKLLEPEAENALLEPKVNAIYVFWHSKTFLILHVCRNLNIGVLTLLDWKNLIYDKLCRLFGYQTVPVANFETAGVRLKNLLDGGYHIALAMDGPKGPAGVLKRGALHLSRTTGKPIVALNVQYQKSFRVKSRWDRYEIPFPFTTAVFRTLDPLQVDENNLEEAEAIIMTHLGTP